MQHRIRAAALVVEGDSVLLVQHQLDKVGGGQSWWLPPGGGVEGDESLVECARRETLEETGLSVNVGKLAYVREFVALGYHNCELFFVATSYSGTLKTGGNPDAGTYDLAYFIKEARFVRRDEMDGMTIYPEEIKTTFWDDLASGFPETRYLGLRRPEAKAHLDHEVAGD